jgi:hypothetical protein
MKERFGNGSSNFFHPVRDLPAIYGKYKDFYIIRNSRIEGYYRYVGDILIVYNEN